jgi:hypothetical protein
MHQLAVGDEVLVRTVIVVVPEGLDVVADVAVRRSVTPLLFPDHNSNLLDCHQSNTSQQTHKHPKLPELNSIE